MKFTNRLNKKILCLKILLKVYVKLKIIEIDIAIDAQILLSWAMTDPCKIKTKNQLAKTRLKDILPLTQEIKKTYILDIQLKYFTTKKKLADMLTRGLKQENFWQRYKQIAKCPTVT